MSLIEYKEKDFSFLIVDEDLNLINCPYLFTDKDIDGNILNVNLWANFIIKIVHKKGVPENEIRNIYVKENNPDGNLTDKRIGWIIPFSSLISKDHDYADNIHFGYYAFYAYVYLLNNEKVIASLKTGKSFKETINELFIEKKDSVIFIVEKENVKELQNLECYEISMYQYGYYREYYRVNPNCTLPKSQNEVHLKKTSDIFFSENEYREDYIKLFIYELYFELNPKIRFFMLYQMIEILIDDIMINQLQKLIDDYKTGKVATRGLDTSIKANTELSRINKMIKLSKLNIDNYKPLHYECNNYLIKKGHDSVSFPDSLYHFRNMMVHRFRSILDEEMIINKINDLIEIFLFDILINYKREQ